MATLVLGCSGSGDDDTNGSTLTGEPLDCAWLMSDNCWKTTVAAAASCVPDASTQGVLSADGTSCVYTSGTSVAFNQPVVLPLDTQNTTPWNFVESSGGQACVTYDSHADSTQTLTVLGLTYSEKTAGVGLQITCPDGTQYATTNAFDLFNCDDFFNDAPGYTDSSTDTSVNFALLSGNGDTLPVFDCAEATPQ
jgi:hypothetical protein